MVMLRLGSYSTLNSKGLLGLMRIRFFSAAGRADNHIEKLRLTEKLPVMPPDQAVRDSLYGRALGEALRIVSRESPNYGVNRMRKRSLKAQPSTGSRVLQAACLVGVLLPFGTLAQESRGFLSGHVTDNSGGLIAGATVEVTNTATNTASRVITNQAGVYTALYLIPGPYIVTFDAEGFKKLVRQGIEIRVGDRLTLDVKLEVGGIQETVTVTGENTPLLDTVSASMGQVIDHRRVSELPLGEGNPLTLLRVAPGVAMGAAFFNSGSALSNSGPSSFVVDGALGGNEFTLDGAPNSADSQGLRAGLRVGLQPPTDAVEEFRVVSASFDAQQGHTSGSSIDVAIRSGTNTPNGSLYEFLRNDVLSANSFFLNRSPIALDSEGKAKRQTRRYHRYGGSLGAPVWLPKLYNGRDKTFFFVSYEGIRTISPDFATYTFPLMTHRAGDFSDLGARGLLIYDPLTARSSGDRVVRDPIQCGGRINVICPDRIGPIAKRYLSFVPAPNLPGTNGNFYGNASNFNRYWVLVTRVDHSFGARHKVFFRYSYSQRMEDNENYAGTNNGVRLDGRRVPRGNRGGVYDHVYVASPSTILNVRVAYTRFLQKRTHYAEFDLDPASLGFSQRTLSYYGSRGLPLFNIGGFSAPDQTSGFVNADRLPSVAPVLTKIHGSHNMRFGYEFRVYQENRQPQELRNGSYQFANNYTRVNDLNTSVATELNQGQSLAALLLGIPTGGSFSQPADRANTSMFHGLFVQNDWKVTRRLTLNLGVRYEYERPATERYDRNTRGFETDASSPAEAAVRAAYERNPIPEIAPANFRVRGGFLFPGAGNRGFYNADRNNIQPRLGFALQLGPKTVVRGGFAISYAPFVVSAINQPGFNGDTPINATSDLGLTFNSFLADAFPNGLNPARGAADGFLTFVGRGITIVPVDRKSGQSRRFQVSLQRELAGRTLAEVSFIGTRGLDLTTNVDFNAIPAAQLSTSPVRAQAVIDRLSTEVRNPFAGVNGFEGTPLYSNATVQRQQLLRPYPQFTGISSQRYDGTSNYNAAALRVEKRFAHGYTILGSYTFSKGLESITLLNATDRNYEKRLADADAPHRVSMSGIWELPFGKGRRFGSHWSGAKEVLLGGFQVQGLFTYQSGNPLTLGNVYFNGSIDSLRSDISGSTIGAIGSSNVLDNVFRADVTKTGFYFTDAAVQTNGVVDPAKQRSDPRINLSQNIRTLSSRFSNLRSQSINAIDLSVLKNFAITERMKLQFRCEALNATNHPSFSAPDLNPRNPTFGRVTSTAQVVLPREFQLGLKLLF